MAKPDWLNAVDQLVTFPAQVGESQGLTPFDAFEATIRDPDAGFYREGHDDAWGRGLLVPMDDTQASVLNNLMAWYLDALQWATASMPAHGKHGQRIPPEAWASVYPGLDSGYGYIPAPMKTAIMQAAFHSAQPVKELLYLPIDPRCYTLRVPSEAQQEEIAPFTGAITIKSDPPSEFGALLRFKDTALGMKLSTIRVYTQVEQGFFPVEVRTYWRYIGYGTAWRGVKALAEEWRKA